MERRLKWKISIAVFLLIVAFIYLFPSISKRLPTWWPDFFPKEKIHLGLDLQGGMHLILEVQTPKAVESNLERTIEDLRYDLRKNHIRYRKIERLELTGIRLELFRQEDLSKLSDILGREYPDFYLAHSQGEANALKIDIILKEKARHSIMKMASSQALETIRNRIDQFGVREPDIRPQGENRILIQLPGIKDPKRAISLIGRTARLEFKLVDETHDVREALKGDIPPGRIILYKVIRGEGGIIKKEPFLLYKRTLLTGEYLTDARVQIDPQYGTPYVSLSFDSRGARIFEKITGENIGRRLAIVLDNNVYSAPVIRDKISGGRAQITGNFTMQEAKDLAIVLRAGSLPAPIKILENRTVGPSLGRESIEKGFKSMIIGGAFVLIFMVIYYRISGLIADLALLLNVIFIMSALAFFGATLTLPGIAGIILTIGMAVDANVLIFERIREELRLGKSPRAALDSGYSKAIITILDANVTTFIAALVLFQFGSGPIKGFAVTLSIGIVSSFITAVFLARIIFDYLIIYRRWKRISI